MTNLYVDINPLQDFRYVVGTLPPTRYMLRIRYVSARQVFCLFYTIYGV